MADDDLSKLRIEKSQFLPRGRRRKGLLFLIMVLTVLASAGYMYFQGILKPAVEVQIAPVTTIYPFSGLRAP